MNVDAMVCVDVVDAVELGEICEFIAGWLNADPDAAASYDRRVGRAGQATELCADLARLADVLMTAKVVSR